MNSILRRRRALMGAKTSDILYELHNRAISEELIDTGVKLLSTDIDWTITYDITITNYGNSTACSLLNCGGYSDGLRIRRGGSGGGFANIMSYRSTEYRVPNGRFSEKNRRWKIVIAHEKNSGIFKCACIRSDNNVRDTGDITKSFSAINDTLTLGEGSGVSMLPTGTIHSVVVYNRAFTTEEIAEFTTF